jgi:hypothetical protein
MRFDILPIGHTWKKPNQWKKLPKNSFLVLNCDLYLGRWSLLVFLFLQTAASIWESGVSVNLCLNIWVVFVIFTLPSHFDNSQHCSRDGAKSLSLMKTRHFGSRSSLWSDFYLFLGCSESVLDDADSVTLVKVQRSQWHAGMSWGVTLILEEGDGNGRVILGCTACWTVSFHLKLSNSPSFLSPLSLNCNKSHWEVVASCFVRKRDHCRLVTLLSNVCLVF